MNRTSIAYCDRPIYESICPRGPSLRTTRPACSGPRSTFVAPPLGSLELWKIQRKIRAQCKLSSKSTIYTSMGWSIRWERKKRCAAMRTWLFALDGKKFEVEENLMTWSNADEPVAGFAREVFRWRVVLVWEIRTSYDAVIETAYIRSAICKRDASC